MVRRFPVLTSFQGAAAVALLVAGSLLAGCSSSTNGPTGVGSDADHDGVADAADNCPGAVNSQQFDTDSDGVGNACDNCPFVANASQADTNGDGVGDACGSGDADGDGVLDGADNCRFSANPSQADRDMDGAGDACDGDLDGDGIANEQDTDIDGDGVANAQDSQPENGFACRDVDQDTCDDCSSGLNNPANDGLDSNGDGICDAGLGRARLTLGVTAPTRVFATQVSTTFNAARFSVAAGSVKGLGPYDPASYLVNPPGIIVNSNTAVPGVATIGATFTQVAPDPSFLPPSNVFSFDVLYPTAGGVPVLSDFTLSDCEVVALGGGLVAGASCVRVGVTLIP